MSQYVIDGDYATRLLTAGDAGIRWTFLEANRAYLKAWMPRPNPEQGSLEGQQRLLERFTDDIRSDRRYPFGLFERRSGVLVGWVSLNNVVRGAFFSADVGYVVGEQWQGRGLATRALQMVSTVAFRELGLHRLQAAVMPKNLASLKVMARSGFAVIGLAPRYLSIDGCWEDHLLHQKIAEG